jgi:hypothetical protein
MFFSLKSVVQPNLGAVKKLQGYVAAQFAERWPGQQLVGALEDDTKSIHEAPNRLTATNVVVYVTAEWLLRELFKDKDVLVKLKCTHLILDEVHERTAHMDMLVSALHTLLVKPYVTRAERLLMRSLKTECKGIVVPAPGDVLPRLLLMSAVRSVELRCRDECDVLFNAHLCSWA